MGSSSSFTFLVLLTVIACCHGDLGFIFMRNSVDQSTIEECSEFNPKFAPYPETLDNETKGTPVIDLYPRAGCEPPDDPSQYNGKIVITKRHKNCTFATRARHIQNANGKGVIVVSEDGLTNPGGNDSDYKEVKITVSIITNTSYKNLHKAMNTVGISNIFFKFYAPETPYWDPNAAVMWFIAVVTCAVGAWSQGSHYSSEVGSQSTRPSSKSGEEGKERSNDEMNVTVVHAVVFFGMCSVSILLMYFFYEYLVYVIIVIFCFASCIALYDFFETFFEKSPCFTRHRIPANSIPILKARPPIFSLILFLLCAGIAIFWAVKRHASYAWILQDILGFAFCIHMIKQIRLPSFKVSTILLVLFFVYDIFYVFITPLFTKNNESIMVNIATGGGGKSTEELPMLFKLPRFGYSPYSKCGPLPFSMLGYGDVILPGLHVGFCAVWDYHISNTIRRHSYFISAVVGYGTGLILTFVGMYLMMTGQPALLYLAPCCLLSTAFVALKRKELKQIWIGITSGVSKVSNSNVNNNEQETLLSKNHENA